MSIEYVLPYFAMWCLNIKFEFRDQTITNMTCAICLTSSKLIIPHVNHSINDLGYTLIAIATICDYDYKSNNEEVVTCMRSINGFIIRLGFWFPMNINVTHVTMCGMRINDM
jgi:hypothetical protein